MKFKEIQDDREFYKAVHEYSSKVWNWRAHLDDNCEVEPTPEELIMILEARIIWVKEHKRTVDKYLRKRTGRTWARVIDGSRVDPSPDHR